jgi:dTDP-4-dehydrorhamnose reductase
MRIMIIGADGQLGTDLVRTLDGELTPLVHADVEISDRASVDAAMAKHRPELVINTAAYHQVDLAEDDPAPAFATNTIGARNLALACAAADVDLFHVSTDYVFGGEKREPYAETDLPGPLNVYGTSKLAGENFVRALAPRSYVARTTGLFGMAGAREGRSNFVETMVRLAGQGRDIKVVADQYVSPTYTYDLAVAMGQLIDTRKYGTYHITNSDSCSWFELATAVFRITKLTPNVSETTSAEFAAKAKRPLYSVLGNKALEGAGVPRVRSWREGLEAYLTERGLHAG